MNVSIIGSGNLAWHLAAALDNTEYAVREVFSRNPRNANALVERLYSATAKTDLDFSASASRIFIIAVTDDAIESVAEQLVLPSEALLLHTSGSHPMSILEGISTNVGVLYPLQTFTTNRKVSFRDIPIFVEGHDDKTEKTLLSMAKAISNKVYRITSAQRKAIHVAAVFASNFTNHMLAISNEIMSKQGLEFEWLKPLIAETINKALALGPRAAQTGPAKRGDLEILDVHMDLLNDEHETIAEIYRVVSQHIVDEYTK